MTQYFYQQGNDITKSQYSGEDSTEVVYSGLHTTQAIGATLGGLTLTAGDIVEMPLLRIPAGASINAIKWAWDAGIANVSSTATFYMRKVSQNYLPSGAATSLNTVSQSGVSTLVAAIGSTTGAKDVFGNSTNIGLILANGAVSGVAGVGALCGVAATAGLATSPSVTAALGAQNGSATILPIGVEGTTYLPLGQTAAGGANRVTLQEDYYLGLLITVGTTGAAILANANIYVGVEAQYVGLL